MAVINSSKFDFSDVIRSELTRYGTQVQEEVFAVLPKVAKEATQKLKSTSPKRRGKYAKGWAYKEDTGRLKGGVTIYGKKRETYALAHLLEKSHAKRGGGRYDPEASGTVHIKPVEEWAINEAYERILQRLEKRS